MMIKRSVSLFLILLLSSANLLAQTGDAQAERAKKAKELEEQILTLLDRTIAEAAGLKLAQNRAVINALIGDLYWRYDPDRSRELFRTASGEIITYQAEVERERLENIGLGIPEMFDGSDPRFEFLNLVGSRDAELALQLMSQTRTPAIAAAMVTVAQQQAAGVTPGIGGFAGGAMGSPGTSPATNAANAMDNARAQQEINLEQSLIVRAAMNDPEKAVKAIKDSLAKGVSTNVIALLQQIMQKDAKLAGDLASDVISKLTSTDLSRSNNDLNGAIGILQYMTRPVPQQNPNNTMKPFAFTESQARDAAVKVANTLLMTSPPAFVTGSLGRAMPMIEKLAPEKVMLLKAKDAANKRLATVNVNARPGQNQRLWNPGDTPENIIAAAAKITNVREKNEALQSAANKIGQIPDEARAKKIIDSIPDEKIRAQAQNQFDANRINRLTVEGRLDEAKASVGALTNRRSQIQRLVALATQYQRKNTEKDRETASSLMTEAKTLGPAYPEDEDELTDYMEVVRGYAAVEPDVGFRMIEPLMGQFDDFVQASAVLSRFNKRDRTFKKGEMVMRINGGANLLPFRFLPQIQQLARADLDRMSLLADRFQRGDARILMKLYILQGHQRSQPLPFAPPPPPRNE